MKTFKRLFMLTLMATMLVTIPGNIKAEGEASVATTITVAKPEDIKGCQLDIDGNIDLNSECFKDKTFRQIVYNTLFDANNADAYYKNIPENKTMLELLSDFDGDINASANTIKKKNINGGELITSVFGLQFLRHANVVNLEHNEISDWTELSITGEFDEFYYGFHGDGDYEDREAGRNVYWKIGGNPLEIIPQNFGGALVIAQAAKTSSEYSNVKEEIFNFLRNTDISNLNVEVPLHEIKLKKPGEAMNEDAPVNSVSNPAKYHDPYRQFRVVTWQKLETKVSVNINNLDTSGQEMIAVGMDQDIKYHTYDEFETGTPGAQSFKYYLHPYFYVYDKLDVVTKEKASIVFTKTDKDTGEVLEGAVYELKNGDQIIGSDYKTNEHGQITFTDLVAGNYTLREVEAPEKYKINPTPIEFVVPSPAVTGDTITISGGTNSFTNSITTSETKVDPAKNEVFLAGQFDDILDAVTHQNKRIKLDLGTSSTNTVKKVLVTYDKLVLDDKTISSEPFVSTFESLEKASEDINTKNISGLLRGDVHVEVIFADHIQDANGVAIHELSQTNEKKPETPPTPTPEDPDTPGRPHKPSDPKDPEEPEIPLIPLEPSTPVEPIEPGPNTPEPPTPGVNTSDSSNPSLWISLMLITSGIMVVVYRKKKQYN